MLLELLNACELKPPIEHNLSSINNHSHDLIDWHITIHCLTAHHLVQLSTSTNVRTFVPFPISLHHSFILHVNQPFLLPLVDSIGFFFSNFVQISSFIANPMKVFISLLTCFSNNPTHFVIYFIIHIHIVSPFAVNCINSMWF